MKKLTDQEFSSLTVRFNRAIDNHFEEDDRYMVSLTDSEYHLDKITGMHVFTVRIIVEKKGLL